MSGHSLWRPVEVFTTVYIRNGVGKLYPTDGTKMPTFFIVPSLLGPVN